MHLLRKQDRSIYYWLSDLFSAYPSISIVDGFPEEELELPTVSIETLDIYPYPLELGNRQGQNDRYWTIDVFARNKDQRDEFTYLIITEMQNGIPVYDYDEGFPPNISPSQIGSLHPENINATPVRVFASLQEKLYWRTTIFFRTDYYSHS
jgi:hypothetical protein